MELKIEYLPIEELKPYANNAKEHPAEQMGKSCYMAEIDPKYCDVIIERWQKFTGEKAVRI